jgi:hypothetical protein
VENFYSKNFGNVQFGNTDFDHSEINFRPNNISQNYIMECMALFLACKDGISEPFRRLRCCARPAITEDYVWVEPGVGQGGVHTSTLRSGSANTTFLGEPVVSRADRAAAP